MVGGNLAALLRDAVDDLVLLETDRKLADESRKAIFKEIKTEGVPPKKLIKLAQSTESDAEEDLKERVLCGAILGRSVYTQAATAEELAGAIESWDPELVTHLKDRAETALSIMQEIEGYKEQIKAKYAEIKKVGLVPSVVRRVVAIKIDPEKKEKDDENRLVLEQYLSALD